ncbi:MAG: 4-(cytidine 5'-diphospho)-2-C-methyl-D-erythritol kinase [Solirubrobacterales bacterium]
MNLRAPAKLNLNLFLGPEREDGKHELCSLVVPLSLADRLRVVEAEADEVVCEGVDGPNLAAAALAELRERGWRRPPLRVEIEKRIPLAAGLGGGSADAAALLRLARGEVDNLDLLAAGLGADVPSQIHPTLALLRGAGERVEELPCPGEFAVLLIADPEGLSTADVFAEADRLGIGRSPEELESLAAQVHTAVGSGASPLDYRELLHNDLERAALSLRPQIREALDALVEAGAALAQLTGSGPTAYGLFSDIAAADRAAASLPPRWARAIVSAPESFL